jgi:NADH:ubiquinone oxidoreductase subunit 3 (subunit A)
MRKPHFVIGIFLLILGAVLASQASNADCSAPFSCGPNANQFSSEFVNSAIQGASNGLWAVAVLAMGILLILYGALKGRKATRNITD